MAGENPTLPVTQQPTVEQATAKLKAAGWDDGRINKYFAMRGMPQTEIKAAPTQLDNSPDGIITEFGKSVYNGLLPPLADGLVRSAQMLYDVTGVNKAVPIIDQGLDAASDWITSNATFAINPEHAQGLFVKDEMTHTWGLSNSRSMLNGIGNGLGFIVSFGALAIGTGGAGNVAEASSALNLAIKAGNVAKIAEASAALSKAQSMLRATNFASGTVLAVPSIWNAGKQAGLDNTTNARFTMALAPIVGYVMDIGGMKADFMGALGKGASALEAEAISHNAINSFTKNNLLETYKGLAGKPMTEDLFKETMKSSLADLSTWGSKIAGSQTMKHTASGAASMYLMGAVQQAGEQLYDSHVADPLANVGEGKFGVDALSEESFYENLGGAIYGGILGHMMGAYHTPVVNQSLYGYLDIAARKHGPEKALQMIGGMADKMVAAKKLAPEGAASIKEVSAKMVELNQLLGDTNKKLTPTTRYEAYDYQFNKRPQHEVIVAGYEGMAKELSDLQATDPTNTAAITAKQKQLADGYTTYRQASESVSSINQHLAHLAATGNGLDINARLNHVSQMQFDIHNDPDFEKLMAGFPKVQEVPAATDGGTSGHSLSQVVGLPVTFKGVEGTVIHEDGVYKFQPEGDVDTIDISETDMPAADFGINYDESHVTQKAESDAVQKQGAAEEVLGDTGVRGEGELSGMAEGNAEEVAQQGEAKGQKAILEIADKSVEEIQKEAEPKQAENVGADAEQLAQKSEEEIAQIKADNKDLPADDPYVQEIEVAEQAKEEIQKTIDHEATDIITAANTEPADNAKPESIRATTEARSEAEALDNIGEALGVSGADGTGKDTGADEGRVSADQGVNDQQPDGSLGEGADGSKGGGDGKGSEAGQDAAGGKTGNFEVDKSKTPEQRYADGKKFESVDGEEVRVLPDGTKRKVKVVMGEASDITPSHDPFTFAKNEGFPTTKEGKTVNDNDYEHNTAAQALVQKMGDKFDNQALQDLPFVKEGIVYSGNNRTMSRQRAAANGTDTAYVESVQKKLRALGFTQEQFDALQNPTVWYEVVDDVKPTTEEFRRYNQGNTKQKPPIERAIELGKVVPDATVTFIANRMDGYDSLAKFFASKDAKAVFDRLQKDGLLTDFDKTAHVDNEGNITESGKEYISSLLMGKILSEDSVRALSQDGLKSIRDRVMFAVKEMADNIRLGEYSIRDDVNNAVKIQTKLRELFPDGFKISEDANSKLPTYEDAIQLYLSTLQIFDRKELSGDAVMLNMLLNKGDRNFKDAIKDYNTRAGQAAGGQGDLFGGDIAVKPKTEVLKELMQSVGDKGMLSAGEKKILDLYSKFKEDKDAVQVADTPEAEKAVKNKLGDLLKRTKGDC